TEAGGKPRKSVAEAVLHAQQGLRRGPPGKGFGKGNGTEPHERRVKRQHVATDHASEDARQASANATDRREERGTPQRVACRCHSDLVALELTRDLGHGFL